MGTLNLFWGKGPPPTLSSDKGKGCALDEYVLVVHNEGQGDVDVSGSGEDDVTKGKLSSYLCIHYIHFCF
jgi:hypothetical protein